MATDWRTVDLSAADQALCEFAVKLTRQQHLVTERDLDDLRNHGFDDRGIHDATQVIAYFNYVTRVAHGLGVDAEDFIEPWGPTR